MKKRAFTITDSESLPLQLPKTIHANFAVANVRRSSPPRRATRNAVVMEARPHSQPIPKTKKRAFIITESQTLHPQLPKRLHANFTFANVRRSSPPQRATRNFVVMEARPHSQPIPKAKKSFEITDIDNKLIPPRPHSQPIPKAKKSFEITDIDNKLISPQPHSQPIPRATRKRVVKTYKLNKNINYRRGLHILKKITEED